MKKLTVMLKRPHVLMSLATLLFTIIHTANASASASKLKCIGVHGHWTADVDKGILKFHSPETGSKGQKLTVKSDIARNGNRTIQTRVSTLKLTRLKSNENCDNQINDAVSTHKAIYKVKGQDPEEGCCNETK